MCLRYCSDYREYYFDSVCLARRYGGSGACGVNQRAAWQQEASSPLATAGETVSGTWLGAGAGWQLSSQSGLSPTLMLVDIKTVLCPSMPFSAISFEINGLSFSKYEFIMLISKKKGLAFKQFLVII